MTIQNVMHNVQNQNVRHEEFNGKDFLVAPMVLLTEGVHAGSGGPLFYPHSELAKTPVVWNMKPVVVYHPTHGRSATDPDVARRRQVGIIMNAHWDRPKLRAEAWLERDRLLDVDERILDALEEGEVMEVSTGVFTDRVFDPGTWNGKEYDFVTSNYRADHLAILPEGVGACSVADGCGLLQLNEERRTEMTHTETPLAMPTMNFGVVPREVCNCQSDDDALPLPAMILLGGDNGTDNAGSGGSVQSHEQTQNNATGGNVVADVGDLAIPKMVF